MIQEYIKNSKKGFKNWSVIKLSDVSSSLKCVPVQRFHKFSHFFCCWSVINLIICFFFFYLFSNIFFMQSISILFIHFYLFCLYFVKC